MPFAQIRQTLTSLISEDIPLEGARGCYQKVQLLNGGVNGRVGLAKSLAVMPGDQVSITAYAKYMNLGTTANPNAFITSLAAAFGVGSGSTGEALKIYNGLNSYAGTVPGGDHYQDNEGAPKAFVTIIFFDKDYNLIDAAWDQVTTTGAQTSPSVKQPPHDVMSILAKAPEAGYAFVFVSNEHFNYVDVYFDDVTVTHTPSQIVSTSDYFPFGLSYNSMERTGSLEQKYLYNSKELQDEMALNWYDYGARMYMPEIGRWGVVDPLSEISRRWTPYAYAFNNPIRFTDPDGMTGEDQTKKDCNCGGELLYSRSYTGKDGKAHTDNYYASDSESGGGGGGGGSSMGSFSSSTRQAINGSNFEREAIANAADRKVSNNPSQGDVYLDKAKDMANQYGFFGEKHEINWIIDYKNEQTSESEPGATNPVVNKDGKRNVWLHLSAFANDAKLFLTMGHEFIHTKDHDSGSFDRVYSAFNAKIAYYALEIRAYRWNVIAEKALNVQYNAQLMLDLYTIKYNNEIKKFNEK